jgi:thiamine-phosphate pyrophosphorylase
MKFVLISIPGRMMGEHLTLVDLFDLGLDTYHIRKPDFTKEQVQNVLNMIHTKNRKKVVLHGHPDLVKKYQLKGIHHNSSSEYIPNFGSEFTQSKSFHNVEDITKDNNPYDYVFLSPIYDSISKEGYNSPFDLKTLVLPKNQNIIALGGITPEKVDELEKAGFSGFATLGKVWHTIIYLKLIKVFNEFMAKR